MADTRQEIDYYDLDENKLMVRDVEITTLAERNSYAAAIPYVLTGQVLSQEALTIALSEAKRQAAYSLDDTLPLCKYCHTDLNAIAAFETAVNALFVIRGALHLAPKKHNPFPEYFDEISWDAYLLFHQTVLLVGSLLGNGKLVAERWRAGDGFQTDSLAHDISSLFSKPSPPKLQSMDPRDKLLTCLIGGFGVAAPTTTLARFSASTRAPLEWSLAASAMGCGPSHLGACSMAMQILTRAFENGANALNVYSENRPFPGFGHPIMGEDPRTSYLFAQFDNDVSRRASDLAKDITKTFDIRPNIDLAAASIFLEWGVPVHLGSVLFWMSRLPILLAHACAKRREPAFGLRASEAREKYREMPRHWV